jgi:hypothetical protein
MTIAHIGNDAPRFQSFREQNFATELVLLDTNGLHPFSTSIDLYGTRSPSSAVIRSLLMA